MSDERYTDIRFQMPRLTISDVNEPAQSGRNADSQPQPQSNQAPQHQAQSRVHLVTQQHPMISHHHQSQSQRLRLAQTHRSQQLFSQQLLTPQVQPQSYQSAQLQPQQMQPQLIQSQPIQSQQQGQSQIEALRAFHHLHTLTSAQQQELLKQHALYQQRQQLMTGQCAYNQDYGSVYRQQGPASGSSNSTPSPLTATASTSGKRGKSKAKRIRTIFTPDQLRRLEQEFTNQMYLVGDDRGFLARSLGLNENQVKVWFQNRRIKFRKIKVQKIQPKSKPKT